MQPIQVVGLGLSTVDVLIRLDEMPGWVENFSHVHEIRMDGGGPAGTGIAAAARLGARTGFVGTCGNDEVAELKLAYLKKYGIDTSRMVRRSSPESQIVMCYVQAASGERVFSGARNWLGEFLKPEELDRDYITSADYLHMDGFHYEASLHAARWMHEAGKKVVLDAGKVVGDVDPKMRALVELTDVLICGSGFGSGLTGKTDIWEIGEALRKIGPQIVVQTEGADGSYTLTDEEHFHTPAFKVQVVDTTGAGDVFHGAYIVGMLHGWNVRTIATFATAVSALKCKQMGGRASIPCLDQVREFLTEQGISLKNLDFGPSQ